MKIDFFKASSAYSTQSTQNTQPADSAKTKDTTKKTEAVSVNNQDRIELSPRAKKAVGESSIKASIKSELTKTDEAKLERLSNLIAKGEYNISSEKIADAILGKSK